jgi:enoyl-CoA hydratase/carnithine racemase
VVPRGEILDVLDVVAADDQIRVLVVTGETRVSAGGRHRLFSNSGETKDEQGFRGPGHRPKDNSNDAILWETRHRRR